jgi:hypothetical protein
MIGKRSLTPQNVFFDDAVEEYRKCKESAAA